MLVGLQAGFGDPIGVDTLKALRARLVDGVRLDVRGAASEAWVRALIGEAYSVGLEVLAIASLREMLWLPAGTAVELENEPDLNGPSATEYAERAREAIQIAHARGLRLWVGAVSNLNRRGLDYLAAVVGAIPARGVGVTVHRYPHGSDAMTPHDGFASRDAEVAALRRIIGDRPWGVSEFGYHTAPRRRLAWLPWWTTRWTDAEVGRFVAWEWAFWRRQGARFAVLYQLNDGPTEAAEDRYGIRTVDGAWKPSACLFAAGRVDPPGETE
ncbi:MAG: hypothetical protein AB7O67_16500 [Vicinamibacterales bacterium]